MTVTIETSGIQEIEQLLQMLKSLNIKTIKVQATPVILTPSITRGDKRLDPKELFQGMGNKNELAQVKKKIKFYDVVQIDNAVSEKAIEFIEAYNLSHGLKIPDAIIGATAVIHQIPIYTYNLKDFDFLPGIILYQPA